MPLGLEATFRKGGERQVIGSVPRLEGKTGGRLPLFFQV